MYGKGRAAGTASIVNFVSGETVPNLAIVRPGTDGKLTIELYGQSGTAHVVVDVFGWFSTSTYAGRDAAPADPVTPARILDTRTAAQRPPTGTPLAAGETSRSRSAASTAQPADGRHRAGPPNVVGVVLNMAGINDVPAATPPTSRRSPTTCRRRGPTTSTSTSPGRSRPTW